MPPLTLYSCIRALLQSLFCFKMWSYFVYRCLRTV